MELMRCTCLIDSNLGYLCHLTNAICEFGFKRANKCPNFIRATLHNEKIKLKPIKPIKDRTKEAYELYWKHIHPKDVKDEALKQRLIEIINAEERTNEDWRNYR